MTSTIFLVLFLVAPAEPGSDVVMQQTRTRVTDIGTCEALRDIARKAAELKTGRIVHAQCEVKARKPRSAE